MKRAMSGFAVLVALGLTGVVQAKENKDLAKRSELCGEIAELRVNVQGLTEMQPDMTVADIKDNAKTIDKKAAEVTRGLEDYKKVKPDGLKQSKEGLKHAIDAVPSNATVDQAKQMLMPQITHVRQATDDLNSQLNCGM